MNLLFDRKDRGGGGTIPLKSEIADKLFLHPLASNCDTSKIGKS